MKRNSIIKIIGYITVVFIFCITYLLIDKTLLLDNHLNNNQQSTSVFIRDTSDFNNTIKISNYVDLPPVEGLNESYGLKIYDANGQFINRKNINVEAEKPMKLFVSAINATSHDDYVGILIALDGEFKNFTIDDALENHFIYITELSSMSQKTIPITLSKNEISNSARLDIVMLYYLNEIPGEKMRFIDFYINSISFTINNLTIKDNDFLLTKAQENYHNICKTPDRFIGKIRTKGVRNTIDTRTMDQTNLSQQNSVYLNKISNQPLYLYGAGGKGRYATTVFINNKPVKIENSKTSYYELTGDDVFVKEFYLENTFEKGKYISYSLSIPLDDSPFIYGSQKFLLEVE